MNTDRIKREVEDRTGVQLLHCIHTAGYVMKFIKAGEMTTDGKPKYHSVKVREGLGVAFQRADGQTLSIGIHLGQAKLPENITRLCSLIQDYYDQQSKK